MRDMDSELARNNQSIDRRVKRRFRTHVVLHCFEDPSFLGWRERIEPVKHATPRCQPRHCRRINIISLLGMSKHLGKTAFGGA